MTGIRKQYFVDISRDIRKREKRSENDIFGNDPLKNTARRRQSRVVRYWLRKWLVSAIKKPRRVFQSCDYYRDMQNLRIARGQALPQE